MSVAGSTSNQSLLNLVCGWLKENSSEAFPERYGIFLFVQGFFANFGYCGKPLGSVVRTDRW
jgi:hypothetical protein